MVRLKKWTGKGVEGNGRGIIPGTIPEFFWLYWGKPRKHQLGHKSPRPRFEPGISIIQNRSVIRSAAMLCPMLSNYIMTQYSYIREIKEWNQSIVTEKSDSRTTLPSSQVSYICGIGCYLSLPCMQLTELPWSGSSDYGGLGCLCFSSPVP
jgi:hypothetical protein